MSLSATVLCTLLGWTDASGSCVVKSPTSKELMSSIAFIFNKLSILFIRLNQKIIENIKGI